MLALENVSGLISSRNGADFAALVAALDALGYRVGALEIDAARFTPQSRARLFVIASRRAPAHLVMNEPQAPFHSQALRACVAKMPDDLRARFVWWRLATPPVRNAQLIDLLDEVPDSAWRSDEETEKLIAQMSPLHRARLDALKQSDGARSAAFFVAFAKRMASGCSAPKRASMA